MNELLKNKLSILAGDESSLMAIQEIFSEQIELEKPTVEKGDNDSVLGQKFRAYEKAKEILKQTLFSIQTYKINKENNNAFNKAK
jgi:hypothetical protein